VPVKRAGVIAFAIAGLVGADAPAWGQGDDDEDDEDERSSDDEDDDERRRDDDEDDEDDGGDDDDRGGGVKANKKSTSDDDDDDGDGGDGDGDGGDDDGGDDGPVEEEFERQKDHTRPGGGRADQNSFQRVRFFVDKEESAKSAKGTLVQGSLTSSSFYYTESGGEQGGIGGGLGVQTNSEFSRMFTDLRAQLDAIHIAGSRWDFRLDSRVRAVNDPGQTTLSVDGTDFPTRVQSGAYGRNELELKEAWIGRGGERADFFLGRQYIADLGAIKFDGLRIDYAQSSRFTVIAFGGTYPFRSSRSIGFDYPKSKDVATGARGGRIIPFVFGGGAAYRTERTYGSFGGVAIVPLKDEQPRVYATSSGYWRTGPKLDFYHFALVDLYGSADFTITNLSAGINYKPAQRMRLTASLNRVDTETLNITAQTFLTNPEPGVIRNDTTIERVASDQVRTGLSVALGQMQQMEVSTSLAYRRRPAVELGDGTMTLQTLDASSSIEVLFQLLHRNLKGMRVGLDGSRIFKVGGGNAYARSASFTGRLYTGREFREGRGEWQADVAYTTAKDVGAGMACLPAQIETCYGTSKISLLELGGTVYYRIREDLFGVGMLNVGRYNAQAGLAGAVETDAPVTSISGFVRLAYRF
jgi:hypothetical protein